MVDANSPLEYSYHSEFEVEKGGREEREEREREEGKRKRREKCVRNKNRENGDEKRRFH